MFGLLKLCRVVLTGIWSWLSLTLSQPQPVSLLVLCGRNWLFTGRLFQFVGQATVSGQLCCIGTVDAILGFDIRQLMVPFSNFDPNVNSVEILTPLLY